MADRPRSGPFWDALGPLLPPRNAYVLLRNTVYFAGNGISQALTILLADAVVSGGILADLDWRPPPEPAVPGLDAETTSDAGSPVLLVGLGQGLTGLPGNCPGEPSPLSRSRLALVQVRDGGSPGRGCRGRGRARAGPW